MGGDDLLLLLLDVVVLFVVSALAGRGGEGSGDWRWVGAVGGWPWRRRRGWKKGGSWVRVLWSFSFIASQFCRSAADGSCGRLQGVVVLASRRKVVRRRRRCLGSWELGDGSDCVLLRWLGVLCASFWVFVYFSFLSGPVCNLY